MAAVIAVAACSAVSCGKDKDSGSIDFERPAVYLDHRQSETVGFSINNIKVSTLSITTKPSGWDNITLDAAARTVTVVSPRPRIRMRRRPVRSFSPVSPAAAERMLRRRCSWELPDRRI